jgi:hypothetical protein
MVLVGASLLNSADAELIVFLWCFALCLLLGCVSLVLIIHTLLLSGTRRSNNVVEPLIINNLLLRIVTSCSLKYSVSINMNSVAKVRFALPFLGFTLQDSQIGARCGTPAYFEEAPEANSVFTAQPCHDTSDT